MRQYLDLHLSGKIKIPCSMAQKKTSGTDCCGRGGIRTPDTVVRSHVL
jgi:hypothetical protein